MAAQVPVQKAEEALLGFIAKLLQSWPPWLETAIEAMRRSIADVGARLPDSMAEDEVQIAVCQKRIKNLIDQLADGVTDSIAIRHRLNEFEREAEILRRRLDDGVKLRNAVVAMPDDAWLRKKLSGLSDLLKDDPQATALLLRRLLGRVRAEAIVAPGKTRGFIRLHVSLEPPRMLGEMLGGQLPESVIAAAASASPIEPIAYQLDLGKPTRRDDLMPEVVAMRDRGETWAEIDKATRLGIGNAHNLYKRWMKAQSEVQLSSA